MVDLIKEQITYYRRQLIGGIDLRDYRAYVEALRVLRRLLQDPYLKAGAEFPLELDKLFQ